MTALTEHRRRIDAAVARYDHAAATLRDERQALENAQQDVLDAAEAQLLLQSLAQEIQERTHRRIAAVVTRCLTAVFGDDAYEFRVVFEKKRQRTEARLTFVRDGNEVDPLEAAGGGAAGVAAFALRVACLMLMQPARRRVLVLDEPFRDVNGEEYQSRVAALLESLADDLGVQFLIVSDDDWLRVGKVIDLE